MRASFWVLLLIASPGCSALLDWGSFRAAPDALADAGFDASSTDALDAMLDTTAPETATDDAPGLDADDRIAPTDTPADAPTDAPADAPADVPVPPADAPADVPADASDDAGVPPELLPPSPVVQIAAGDNHTCARLMNGSVWCWGDNEWGQLGDGSLSRNRPVPRSVILPGGQVADDLVTGGFHTCVRLSPSHTLYCWGRNDQHQLGGGASTLLSSSIPVPVSLAAGAWKLTAGALHTCASQPGSPVYCWGYNASGQCGAPITTMSVATPTAVAGTDGARTAAAGKTFTCALSATQILCWGANEYRQLGDPVVTAASRATAAPVPLGAAASGGLASLAVGGFQPSMYLEGGLPFFALHSLSPR